MKDMKKTFAFVAIAVMAAACSGNGKTGEQAAEETVVALPKVTVTQVGSRDVDQQTTFTSTVQANIVNNIAPQSSNRIKKTYVEIGDFVSKGQILAKMDVANLEQLKLQLVNDSTELVRIKGLYEVGGVSKSDLDAIEMSYNVKKTSYNNLQENTILRSPISGVVTARNYDQGDMYSMSQPLYTVQQITPVKLLVGISESQYTKVKKGDKVAIEVDALPGQTFNGTISRLYPVIDPATHTLTVEVKVPNTDRKLRPGMYAKVTVKFGVNHSVVIPDRAVVRQQGAGDKFVYIYNEDGTVTFKKVTLGVRLGAEFEVLEGVNDGDKVVVAGQVRIKDGIAVDADQEQAEEAAQE